MQLNLSGSTVLVTGASSGLGAHFSRVVADAGASVILAARRTEKLAVLVSELRQLGCSARAIVLDVTNESSIDAAIERAGSFDVLINNAGVADTKAAHKTDGADFDRVVGTNLRGAYLMAAKTAASWIEQDTSGKIVNVASILGERVAAGVAPYAVSKAGVLQMTKAMALEWARYGIRVNALAPGYLATELNTDFFQSEAGQALIKRVPMRRLGKLSELDVPLLLLAGSSSSFMTGSVLAVDGGHLVSSL